MKKMLQKKRCLSLKTFAVAVLMVIFAIPAKAQRNVLMQNGSTTLTAGETVNFYDSHGPSARSAADGNKMDVNYWDKWYVRNEGNGNGFVYTFNAPDGYDVKVEFKTFEAYTWSDEGDYTAVPPVSPYNCASIGDWAFRINDDWLYAYEGTAVLENKLIGAYTGNTEHTFTIMAQGSITFKFVSNAQFQEEGWYAEVKAVPHSQFVPTPPFIRRSTCSDDIELVPTTLGATMSYTTNNQTPAPGNPYNAPIDWPAGSNITVKAIATLNGVSSSVATATFTDPDDRIPHINTAAFAPTIDRVTGENKVSIYCPPVPAGLNETFFVSYTTDGTEPSRTNGTIVYYTYTQIAGAQDIYYGGNDRTYVFGWDIPNTTIKAKVFAFSCTNDYMESPMAEYDFGEVYVPAPEINVTGTYDATSNPDGEGSGTISCSLNGATIYYTLDGSTPTTSSTLHGTTPVSLSGVPAGTTIKAMAHMEGQNYQDSPVVTFLYVPTGSDGQPQNGVYGGVVLLDDREDHSWKYYTEESPIHSLNPADVKITYRGYGENTMTTTNTNATGLAIGDFNANVTSTQVAVNHDATENQFIYLKTLEAANEDGSGNYPYTMIPNPFQVRPIYSGSQANRTFVVTLTNSDNYDNWNHDNGSTVTISYGNTTQTLNGPAANGTVNQSFTVAVGTQVTITFNANGNGWASYCRIAVAYDDNTTIFSTYNPTTSGNNPRTFTVADSSGSNDAKYRGFYAWKVKRLSSGLTIKSKDGNTTYGENTMIPAETEVQFLTSNEEGNEVEFEALWAKAWVTTSTNTSGLNANASYERNFMVLNSNASPSTNTISIGTGSATNFGMQLPFNSSRVYYDGNAGSWYSANTLPYSFTEQIFTASEIGGDGVLTSMDFYVDNVNTTYDNNLQRNLIVYVKYTSLSEFRYAPASNGTYRYWMESISASDRVFSGTVNFNSTGWKTITFDTPFEYDGLGNLVVCVIDNTGTLIGSNNTSTNANRHLWFGTYSTNSNRALSFRDDTSPVSTLEGGTYYGSTTAITYNNRVRFNKTINANGTNLSNLSVPLTVTTCYPDGSGLNNNIYVSGSIYSGADLKLENIKLNGTASSIINANGHDLVIGRGVTPNSSNGICTSIVKGTGTGSSNAMDYTMRIESGVIQSFYPGYENGTTIGTFSNTFSVRAILGSDYDRANNDNSKLSISPSTHAGEIYGGNRMHCTDPANKENMTFDWTIKSGNFHDGILGAGEGGDQSVYLGSSQASGSSTTNGLGYIGKRRAVVEGGELASLAGGMNQDDESNYATYGSPNVKDMVSIRMRGGNIRGAIYGAAAFAGAVGGRTFVITGGQVLGWIAGGCNGTHTTGGELYGDSYIYVGGKVNVGNSSGGNHVGGNVSFTEDDVTYYGINGADGGIIFGAGCGINPTNSSYQPDGSFTQNTVGRTSNTNVVISDEAVVWRDVYGGGNFGFVRGGGTSDLRILGGTVKGNVYGGANSQQAQTVNISMTDGSVEGNIYGGSNSWGTTNNLATINVSGGTVTNVFGGGYGASTIMASDVFVNVSGNAVINENVYGGGEQGTIGSQSTNANTDVTISGGTVKGSVYGAGLGTENTTNTDNPTNPTANANIYGNTTVLVSGGIVEGSVYGGGENGSVAINASGKKSTVGVSGGTINGSVFGGGSEGFTNGATVVNLSGGVIKGSAFGGAYGKSKLVYVNGTHTVNVMGGDEGIPEIRGSVYGGSRLANDGNSFTLNDNTFNSSTASQLSSVVNISGARIKEHVYASGYYGRCFGSVYVHIGENAIDNATVALGNNTADKASHKDRIFIEGSVWAGSDWGVFSGDFGAPTISGNSNIFLDGTGYNVTSTNYTDSDYMGIGMSILGCGTSCDAGKGNRDLLVRNYGTPILAQNDAINPVSNTTRSLNSIQRFKKVTFDKSHLTFTGQGRVNSLNTTEKYSIYSIVNDTYTGKVYVANGSTLIMNYPASELNSFHSVTCADPYVSNPSYPQVTRDALYGSSLNGTSDNKIRVNGGSFVEVKYAKTENSTTTNYYGELEGYFHMMADDPAVLSSDATCAYARPKQAEDSQIASTWDNPNDGGFLSYDSHYNTWSSAGAEVGANSYQLPYENHAPTRNDSEYFRIWRFGGNHHTVEGVVTVQQNGHSDDEDYCAYQTVAVTIQLPAWRTENSYYRFDRTGDVGSYFSLIDYGVDVMTFNAANTYNDATLNGPTPIDNSDNHWLYYNGSAQATGVSSACPEIDKLSENADMNFGLVIMPGDAMTSASNTVSNYLICSASDSYIAENMQYNCSDYLGMPTVTFIITYRNDIHSNTTWDPITIPLVQCTPGENNSETEWEYVNVSLTINTMTDITSTFKTQVYAIMNGGSNTHNTTLQTITLPTFNLLQTENMDLSTFTVLKADFVPAISLVYNNNNNSWVEDSDGDVDYKAQTVQELDINSFGLTLEAVMTPDNSDDWRDVQPAIDGAPGDGTSINKKIAESGGRTAVALGFNLYYSDVPKVQDVTLMGTVTFTIKFNNYADGGSNHEGTFTVEVEVYRKGPGVNFFVDGVNGKDEIDNQKHRGHYPNFAAKSVEFVLSRLGFTAGDNIFIVNQVDVSKNLKYDGSRKQNNINIWRYPGNHTLKSDAPLIIGNQDNLAYTGLLFNLNDGANLKVIGAKIDGMYAEASLTNPNLFDTHIFPRPNGATLFNGEAAAPVFKLNEGASLMMNVNTRVQNNYNKAASKEDAGNAGGIYIASGAVLAMNGQTKIVSNYNDVAGGVYMDGSMIVSDDVEVNLNKKTPTGNDKSNVWLTNGSGPVDEVRVVQIGNANMSSFGPLTLDARIGINKEFGKDGDHFDDYLPVVFTETANDNYVQDYLKDPFDLDNDDDQENNIIFHDEGKYKLTKYTPDNYLYWLSTWVTFQDHEPNNQIINGVNEGGWDGIGNIHTPQQLAWFISLVNGENGAIANTFAGQTVNITADITMDGHIWVPVGTPTHPFKGTFEGNGHVITDMYGSLILENMGMFGNTVGATVQNAVVKTRFTGTNDNLGTVIGTMNGGTLRNVEGAGSILNKLDNSNMGGLVGHNNGGTIHSAFAVADMTGGANMGGLVGKNAGNLYNSYSNVDFAKYETQTSNMFASGLVAENAEDCIVENCYVIEGNHSGGTFYSFAKTNDGDINYCYVASTATTSLVSDASTGDITGEGTYDAVKARKELGYMYGDNKVTKTDADDANNYITPEDKVYYASGRIDKWRGLLSTLNQWVSVMNGDNSPLSNLKPFTVWFRSTSSYLDANNGVHAYINGDLPVLGFPKDNAMGTLDSDGKFLRYGSNVGFNGVDDLLSYYNDNDEGDAEPDASIFHYGKAEHVKDAPTDNVKVFINEDAVLIQDPISSGKAEDEYKPFKAVVGITFDNSSKKAHDYYNNVLEYDWHMMATPLSDADLGAVYNDEEDHGWDSDIDIQSMTDGYFPNGLPAALHQSVKWDFYNYYEPEYHWINLKRNKNNHYHIDPVDGVHNRINYNEADQNTGKFTSGKGYMMAIEKDSYMSSTGTLNAGDVPVTITSQAPDSDPMYNKGWNLVGNPYQAHLDLSALFSDRNNSGKATQAYVYDADLKVYTPFVELASDNQNIINRYVHQHQAFFVHAESDGVALTFKPTMAVAEPASGYTFTHFRGDEHINYPLVNLFAENAAGNRDLAVVEFNRPELGGATKINGLRNANFQIFAHMGDNNYGLLFTPEGTERVPVWFKTEEDGVFTLTWNTLHGDFTSLRLVDNLTGVNYDMLANDSYTFEAKTDDYASRFYITYTCTDIEEYNEGDDTFAFFDGSEWIVNGKGYLEVVDVTGRVLFAERLSNDQNRISMNGYAKGVYLMRISDNKNVKVQKIVVR